MRGRASAATMWEVAGKLAGDEATLKRAGEALAGQKEFEFASRVLTEAATWRQFGRELAGMTEEKGEGGSVDEMVAFCVKHSLMKEAEKIRWSFKLPDKKWVPAGIER